MLKIVRDTWVEHLGKDGFGSDENFFDFGGTSRVIAAVRADLMTRLGREIPLVAFYRYQTIGALAGHLAGGDGAAPPRAGRTRPPGLSGHQRALRGAARAGRTEGDS